MYRSRCALLASFWEDRRCNQETATPLVRSLQKQNREAVDLSLKRRPAANRYDNFAAAYDHPYRNLSGIVPETGWHRQTLIKLDRRFPRRLDNLSTKSKRSYDHREEWASKI